MKNIYIYDFVSRRGGDWKPGEKNQKILQNPEKWLKDRMSGNVHNFGVYEIIQHGIYKEHGWAYDFRPLLKKYIYRQYGDLHGAFALNKTNMRKLIGGVITKIIEE